MAIGNGPAEQRAQDTEQWIPPVLAIIPPCSGDPPTPLHDSESPKRIRKWYENSSCSEASNAKFPYTEKDTAFDSIRSIGAKQALGNVCKITKGSTSGEDEGVKLPTAHGTNSMQDWECLIKNPRSRPIKITTKWQLSGLLYKWLQVGAVGFILLPLLQGAAGASNAINDRGLENIQEHPLGELANLTEINDGEASGSIVKFCNINGEESSTCDRNLFENRTCCTFSRETFSAGCNGFQYDEGKFLWNVSMSATFCVWIRVPRSADQFIPISIQAEDDLTTTDLPALPTTETPTTESYDNAERNEEEDSDNSGWMITALFFMFLFILVSVVLGGVGYLYLRIIRKSNKTRPLSEENEDKTMSAEKKSGAKGFEMLP